MEMEGQWVGKRVLRRIDRDGTEWTIRRASEGVSSNKPWFILACRYRDAHMTSWHLTIDAAKAHADEMLASLVKPKVEDYRVPEESVDQLELT